VSMWLQSIKQCEGALASAVARCDNCGTPMPNKRFRQRFCSPQCQNKSKHEQARLERRMKKEHA
jgi:endogenous inhibitor of DNA gyrase (YacG/DUF329 family)